MHFGEALVAVKQGKAIRRAGWNGSGLSVKAQFPDANSKMTLPYIYMKTADNNKVPWLASQTDMLSEDWEVI